MLVAHTAALAVKSEPLPIVRLAVEDDIPALLNIGREMHAENGIMPLSERMANGMILNAIRKHGAIGGVIGPVGTVEAAILLRISQMWYSEDFHLEDYLCYVRPQYRRSTRAKALIEFAKKAAVDLKVPLLIGIASNDRTEAKIRLYRRQLGPQAGALFLYNGKTGSR